MVRFGRDRQFCGIDASSRASYSFPAMQYPEMQGNTPAAEPLTALAAQMLLLEDGMRGLVQMAIDQGSSGNVRDLLYGIDECLNVMANFAQAVLPSEERGENPVLSGRDEKRAVAIEHRGRRPLLRKSAERP
jgi:hypothetical protein